MTCVYLRPSWMRSCVLFLTVMTIALLLAAITLPVSGVLTVLDGVICGLGLWWVFIQPRRPSERLEIVLTGDMLRGPVSKWWLCYGQPSDVNVLDIDIDRSRIDLLRGSYLQLTKGGRVVISRFCVPRENVPILFDVIRERLRELSSGQARN